MLVVPDRLYSSVACFKAWMNRDQKMPGQWPRAGPTLQRIVTSGSTAGQPYKDQSQVNHKVGLALYLDKMSPGHTRQKRKQAFYPCSNTGHATTLPTFPVCFPSRSLTVLDWRETSWLTEMSNKEGTNTGNSCTALVGRQEQVPPADPAYHLRAKLGAAQPQPGCCAGGCGFHTHLLLVALLF